jgi:hypothetical protein
VEQQIQPDAMLGHQRGSIRTSANEERAGRQPSERVLRADTATQNRLELIAESSAVRSTPVDCDAAARSSR